MAAGAVNSHDTPLKTPGTGGSCPSHFSATGARRWCWYWEHDDPEHHAPAHYGVRTQTHRYIVHYNDGLDSPGSSERVLPTENELHDRVTDPAELTNVADDPAYARIPEELEVEPLRLQRLYGGEPYRGTDTPRLDWSV